jgi:hypothetical protein
MRKPGRLDRAFVFLSLPPIFAYICIMRAATGSNRERNQDSGKNLGASSNFK